MGHPVPRRKHQRQSIRLTRNGFALHGERLYLAKVGDVRVEWSRSLPSVPSSVTVIKDTDGRTTPRSWWNARRRPCPPVTARSASTWAWPAWSSPQAGRSSPTRDSCGRRNASSPRAAGAVPPAERHREPGQGPAPGRGPAPQGAGNPAGSRAQDGASAGPRQPSGLRRRPCRRRADAHPAGQVGADAGWSQLIRCVEEKAARSGARSPDRPVRAHHPGVLGLRGQGRPQAAPSARGRARHAGRSTTGT